MEEITRQVQRAHRRLVFQQFLSITGWSLFATLFIAVVGLAIPKIWAVPVDGQLWTICWLGGAAVVGLLSACLFTWRHSLSNLEAAIEIDRRFGLRERVASSLSLAEVDRETEAGQALLDDTARRVSGLEIKERFGFEFNWRGTLAFLPAIIAFALVLIPDAATRRNQANAATAALEKARVEESAKALKKKIQQKRKKASERGLKDAEMLFQQMERQIDEMTKKDKVDRKQAMISLNNLKQELEQKRESLGGSDKMRQQLNGLKDIANGPADKMAKAIKDGDFGKAIEELNKLKDKLKNGDLNDEQKKQLAQQMQDMKKKLEEAIAAHNQAKQDLQQEIQRLEQAGDRAGANKLRQKLDQLNGMNNQMGQLKEMADQLGKAGQAMQEGKMEDALQQLQQVADGLGEMQQQLDQLETLNDMLDELADAKDAMNCKQCAGMGCAQCQGGGNNQDGPPGFGMGEGQGQGDRPEQETDTGQYETQVRGKLHPGEVVRTGDANGPNSTGKTLQDVKNEIQATSSKPADPLLNQRLPRREREHTKQYFERFRDGE